MINETTTIKDINSFEKTKGLSKFTERQPNTRQLEKNLGDTISHAKQKGKNHVTFREGEDGKTRTTKQLTDLEELHSQVKTYNAKTLSEKFDFQRKNKVGRLAAMKNVAADAMDGMGGKLAEMTGFKWMAKDPRYATLGLAGAIGVSSIAGYEVIRGHH
jgi:hypothetical protein